jgi:dynactin complex subunit
MSPTHHVGQRLSFDGTICTVRYIGEVTGTTGTWLGVEWDAQHRGKHDGSHKGVRYFTCAVSPLLPIT